MRSFRKYVVEFKKEDPKEKESEEGTVSKKEPVQKKDSEESESIDSEIGEWSKKNDTDWVITFVVNGIKYSVALSPLDDAEKHWKYTYYVSGNRDSSNITKFGDSSDWLPIWTTIVEVLKDFIRIFSPLTLKFIGMSISKRPDSYKELFRIYNDNLRFSFRKLGYHSTFDHNDLSMAPSFVVKKGSSKEPEKKKEKQ